MVVVGEEAAAAFYASPRPISKERRYLLPKTRSLCARFLTTPHLRLHCVSNNFHHYSLFVCAVHRSTGSVPCASLPKSA